MIEAAGILFLSDKGETLFLKRGPGSDYPGAWCFPGGQLEDDESTEDAAKRECVEEIGHLPDGTRSVLTRSITSLDSAPALMAAGSLEPNAGGPRPPGEAAPSSGPVDYTTFLQRVPQSFAPEVSGEHTGWAWAKPELPPEPLHPGCRIALERLTMDELGVARAMSAGQLVSPQRYANVWLFDIRITGTGAAYRRALKEHVWRDPSIYLNEEFLARCNGLPVIWEHPKKATLDTTEFEERIVGTVLLPYIKGDEVWGIAKIYDDEAAEEMAANQMSTSPGVVLKDVESSKVKLEDGSVLLIEGKPTLLDHIAICPLGVWDKGGEPSGVRTDDNLLTRIDSMAEEKKNDADAGEKLDKLLTHLDSMSKRFDSIEKRMDEAEEERKADKARRDAEEKAKKDEDEAMMADRAKKDRQARRDAEHKEFEKMDAEACKADDEEEKKEVEELKSKGDSDEDAEDKAREARKERMDKRRKDAEEEKKRADAARKDDVSLTPEELALFRKMAGTKPQTQEELDALLTEQARYDSVYNMLGSQAPKPMQHEALLAYRVRLAGGLQRHSARWKDKDLGKLARADESVFADAEKDIRADAQVSSRNPTDLPDDRLVTVPIRNPVTGLNSFEFRGKHTFIHGMKRPTMYVTRIRDGRN